jgi:hypothetical protein
MNDENCGLDSWNTTAGSIGIGFIVCLLLPSMTSGRVSFEESMLGLIPSVIVFLFAFLLTVISAIFFLKGRKKAA